jgi:hypothetical protein
MGVTRILLLVVEVLLGLLLVASAIRDVLELSAMPLHDEVFWDDFQVYTYFSNLAYYIAAIVISLLAYRDLGCMNDGVREKFLFKYLGWLGWFAIVLFFIAFWTVWSDVNTLWFYAFEDGIQDYDIEILMATPDNFTFNMWLGTLCLYARYRIAANKRLEAM